jgi:hypothetical protein
MFPQAPCLLHQHTLFLGTCANNTGQHIQSFPYNLCKRMTHFIYINHSPNVHIYIYIIYFSFQFFQITYPSSAFIIRLKYYLFIYFHNSRRSEKIRLILFYYY